MTDQIAAMTASPDKGLGSALISPLTMPKDASGNIVQMTVDELRGKLPGLRYEGDKEGGVPHGNGRLSLPCGLVWSGTFAGGTLPRGVLASNGRVTYEGEFLNLCFHGTGRRETKTGCVSAGRFEFNQFVEGGYTHPGHRTYEGGLRDGLWHGQGRLTDLIGGAVWEGIYQDGKFKKGKVVFPNGQSEEGEFSELHLHGKGRITYPDGSEYTGHFRHGKMHGCGTLVTPAYGRTIEGVWRNEHCVCGTITLAAGAIYEGGTAGEAGAEYEGEISKDGPYGSGQMDMGDLVVSGTFDGWAVSGQCTLSQEAADCAEVTIHRSGDASLRSLRCDGHGLVPSPDKTGHATITFPNGCAYAGATLHGQAHGTGELSIPGVGTCTGAFVRGLLEGKATVTFASGATLTGVFHGGLPNGPGHYVSAKGVVFTGHFKDALPCGPGAVFVPGDDSVAYFHVGDGESPSCPAFDDEEILSLGEALSGLCVAFPAQLLVKARRLSGKGLVILSADWGTLHEEDGLFQLVLVPEQDAPAEAAGANADEAKAA